MAIQTPKLKQIGPDDVPYFCVTRERLERIEREAHIAQNLSPDSWQLSIGSLAFGVAVTCGATLGSATLSNKAAAGFWAFFAVSLFSCLSAVVSYLVCRAKTTDPLEELRNLITRTMQQGRFEEEDCVDHELTGDDLQQKLSGESNA